MAGPRPRGTWLVVFGIVLLACGVIGVMLARSWDHSAAETMRQRGTDKDREAIMAAGALVLAAYGAAVVTGLLGLVLLIVGVRKRRRPVTPR
jgi:ABC-type Fe3+ transport system permease subunit